MPQCTELIVLSIDPWHVLCNGLSKMLKGLNPWCLVYANSLLHFAATFSQRQEPYSSANHCLQSDCTAVVSGVTPTHQITPPDVNISEANESESIVVLVR
jgi:hypothetical protein